MSATRARAWRLALALAGLVVAADQGLKALVEANIALGEDRDLLGPIQLTHVGNEGVAFGLAGDGGVLVLLLTMVALGAILAVFALSAERRGMWVAMGLLAGGAAGNLADRARAGAVTDYIDLPAWPAFNLADIAITAGVAILALGLLREPAR